jgi:putative SOS response-associated peptidase YedK
MCGRYTLKTPGDALAEQFGLGEVPELRARYNVAPTQDVACVRTEGSGARRLSYLRWGLVPFWAKDPAIGNRMINARAETVAEKPAFRTALRKRRCLVLADGFYEWAKAPGGKQPWYLSRPDGGPFAFAGLWERWVPRGGDGEGGAPTTPVHSCTIVTTAASEAIRDIHHRMPVILSGEDLATWLDPAVESSDPLVDLLAAWRAPALVAWPVSRTVNSPKNDDPACIARIDAGTARPFGDGGG